MFDDFDGTEHDMNLQLWGIGIIRCYKEVEETTTQAKLEIEKQICHGKCVRKPGINEDPIQIISVEHTRAGDGNERRGPHRASQ